MATESVTTVIPLISSDTAGPLGAIHLPRLWAKLSLGAQNMLSPEYDECGTGFDAMTLAGLNLDRQKTIDFVRSSKPTYMQFEEWVIGQNGGSISAETVRKHNAAVHAFCHDDEKAEKMRKASGIKDAAIKDAVTLNTIEDLDEIYKQIYKR